MGQTELTFPRMGLFISSKAGGGSKIKRGDGLIARYMADRVNRAAKTKLAMASIRVIFGFKLSLLRYALA